MGKTYQKVSPKEMENFVPERKHRKPEQKSKKFIFFLWGQKFETDDESLYNDVKSLK